MKSNIGGKLGSFEKIVESVRFLCRRGTRVAWFFAEYP